MCHRVALRPVCSNTAAHDRNSSADEEVGCHLRGRPGVARVFGCQHICSAAQIVATTCDVGSIENQKNNGHDNNLCSRVVDDDRPLYGRCDRVPAGAREFQYFWVNAGLCQRCGMSEQVDAANAAACVRRKLHEDAGQSFQRRAQGRGPASLSRNEGKGSFTAPSRRGRGERRQNQKARELNPQHDDRGWDYITFRKAERKVRRGQRRADKVIAVMAGGGTWRDIHGKLKKLEKKYGAQFGGLIPNTDPRTGEWKASLDIGHK